MVFAEALRSVVERIFSGNLAPFGENGKIPYGKISFPNNYRGFFERG